MLNDTRSQQFWWDDHDGAHMWGDRVSMGVEAPEQFQHPCGFVKLRERHRVKAPTVRYGKAAECEG